MDKVTGKLTVYFEDPFWVGVFERIQKGKLSVCRVIFGAEPKDYDVYEFVLRYYDQLEFSPAVKADARPSVKNPKRMQREAAKEMKAACISTKSQQALQLQREQMKTEHKKQRREQREEERRRQFEIKQQKRKEKHKGH